MCGICGIVKFNGHTDPSAILPMNNAIAHRGPDDEGYWWDHGAIFGHRRLSVIDLDGGSQPMVVQTPAGDVVISFVGEIYNYLELRQELAAGFTFRTSSDTEVILAGYLKWGEQVAEHLRGMFAFGIWDGRERKLVLGRDHLGVKTLFYYPIADGVLIGSEPKAIFAHPQAVPRIARMGWQEMFTHPATPGHVVWDGMYEVPAGTTVVISPTGIEQRRYWRLKTWEHPHDALQTVQHTRSLLEQIVAEQMVGDVPVGVLNSGGIDSGSLVAFANLNWKGQALETFCIDYAGGAMGNPDLLIQVERDAPWAEMVADHCGTRHHSLLLDSAALADPELMARSVWARDLPHGGGDRDISQLVMYEKVRRHVTVALSGQMADELFGGYRVFFEPGSVNRSGWPWKVLNHREQAAVEYYLHDDLAAALDLPTYLGDTFASAAGEVEHRRQESRRERRLREINYLMIMRHAPYLLSFTDRLSMACGLEVRAPFCDQRLVEYVYNVPWLIKTLGGIPKGLLRAVAAGLLPEPVIGRPKSPFPMAPHLDYPKASVIHLRALLRQSDHRVWQVMHRSKLASLTERPVEHIGLIERTVINQALELAMWLDQYGAAI